MCIRDREQLVQFSRFLTQQSCFFIDHTLFQHIDSHFHHSGSGTFSVTGLQHPQPVSYTHLISDLSPYEHLTNRDGSYTHIVRDYYLPAMERLVGNGFPYSDWFYNPLQEIRSRDRSTKDIKARFQAALTLSLIHI